MTSETRGTLIRLVISLGALALIVFFLHEHLADAFEILIHDVKWSWFALALLTYLGCLIFLAARLLFVFKSQGITMSFSEAFYLTFIGLFFNLFFPSAVGGDVAKAYYAYKHSGDKIKATTCVIMDRLLGFVAIILMAGAALFFLGKDFDGLHVDTIVYIFFTIMVLALLFFGSKRFARNFHFMSILVPSQKWRARISEIYHAIHAFRDHRAVLLMCVFLSFTGTSLFVMMHYWLAESLSVELSPAYFFMLVPIVTIVSMAPSIGGLGVREAGVTYFFSRFIATERAIALSLLLDAVIYSYCLLSGIIFSLRGGLKARVIHEMEELA